MKLGDIDLTDLIAQVRELAADNPEFVYKKQAGACTYWPDDDNPQGCIVGAGLKNLGFNTSKGLYSDFVDRQPHVTCNSWRAWAGKNDRQRRWVRCVQAEQDAGATWGRAVKLADLEWLQ